MNAVPDIDAMIDRRLLLNFRVDPDVAGRVVPAPFRPNLERGAAIAGICLIRLTEVRPRGLPGALGVTVESAAHRFAVEWDTDAGIRHGVFIPRRDTSSRLTVLLGGRVFPGEHRRCSFDVAEADGHCDLDLVSADEQTAVAVSAEVAAELSSDSLFDDVDDASEFFRRDTLGYSQTRQPGRYDGVELHAAQWKVDPLRVERVRSSFFDDPTVFPPGSVTFDCALSMRRTPARWCSRPQLRHERELRVC